MKSRSRSRREAKIEVKREYRRCGSCRYCGKVPAGAYCMIKLSAKGLLNPGWFACLHWVSKKQRGFFNLDQPSRSL